MIETLQDEVSQREITYLNQQYGFNSPVRTKVGSVSNTVKTCYTVLIVIIFIAIKS